jgi:hypothetical protein
MLAHLSVDMSAALAAGDVEAAQVAHAALGKLLALGVGAHDGGAGDVIDLARERERRGGQ